MASGGDFTLYGYQENWTQEQQTYIPACTYSDQPYLAAQSFDAYQQQQQQQHQQDFALQQQQFEFTGNNRLKAPASTSNYSPASSTSQSFDYHNNHNNHHISSISDSGASVQSTLSSAMGSPLMPSQSSEWRQPSFPSIVQHDGLYPGNNFNMETVSVPEKGCVDPSLIQAYSSPYLATQFQDMQVVHAPTHHVYPVAASPDPSRVPIHSPKPMTAKSQRSASPYEQQQSWQPYTQYTTSRRQSMSSIRSKHSHQSASSEDSNKGMCPISTCGRHVKDLKAHMLTHQNERPEKCSVASCEYHVKGFARKYDKNRHTLTHYKGTMVCGFCPGSGSSAEKSFNRADVFKRHLTSVHGVEQTPPNARRKSPTSTGKKTTEVAREVSGMCSTCNNNFANAQDFYEHLDDCVLRVVQRADPSEAINEKLLSSVAEDENVQESLKRHMLPVELDHVAPDFFEEEELDEGDEIDRDDANDGTYGRRSTRTGRPSLKARRNDALVRVGSGNHISANGGVCKPSRRGMTLSKDGVALSGIMSGKGSKRRKNYPLSWGAAPSVMKMKKRVLCVFDGPRRLLKDDMMLNGDHEVRIPLSNAENERDWVTDLDVQTLRRAEGMHNATEEEKGPWINDDDDELENLMR